MRFAEWFTARPLWYLTIVAVAVNALILGIGPVPYLDVAVELMDDPFNPGSMRGVRNVEPGSPAMWIVADLLGVDSSAAFWLLNLAVLVAVLILSAYLVACWVSELAGRLFIAAWFASPLANVNVTWLGKPDHVTILATVLIGLGPPGAGALGGFLLGFNHFEQGIFILIATLLVRLAFGGTRRWVVYMLAGFGAGRALWTLYAADYDAGSRLEWITEDGIGQFVRIWRGDLPTLLFGAFGVVWVAVIAMLRDVPARQRWCCISALVVAIIPCLVTLDTSRVLALLTLPVLLASVIWAAALDRAIVLRWLPWLMLAALFVPRVMLWSGQPYVSSWERFVF